MRKWLVVWCASLIAVAGATTVLMRAQAAPPAVGTIISGNDIGFRVDSSKEKDGGVAGTLVVRIGGRWVKASSMVAAVPAIGLR